MWRFRTIGRIVSITGGHLGNLSPYVSYKRLKFNSKHVREGDLFVALKGEKTDGHLYIDEAFSRGAIAAIVSEDYFFKHYDRKPLIGVDDTLKALWRLAGARMQMEHQNETVAVVGSVGKTTTKELIAHLLSGVYSLYKTPGNFNTLISVPTEVINMPLGIPFSIFEVALHEMGDVEILSRILRPKVLVITAIGAEHLQYLNDISTVKKENLKALKYVKTGGWVVVPGNIYKDVMEYPNVHSDQIITFGRKGHVDISVRNITVDWKGTTFTINAFGERKKIHVPLYGMHYVLDVMAAVAVGLIYDMTLSYIADRLKHFVPVWGRMQVYDIGDIKVIFDAYNASPESMKYFIITLSELVEDSSKLLIVVGDMKELGKHSAKYHSKLAEWLMKLKPGRIILVGEEVSVTYSVLRNVGIDNVDWYRDIDELIDFFESDTMLTNYSFIALKASRSIHLEKLLELVGLAKDEST